MKKVILAVLFLLVVPLALGQELSEEKLKEIGILLCPPKEKMAQCEPLAQEIVDEFDQKHENADLDKVFRNLQKLEELTADCPYVYFYSLYFATVDTVRGMTKYHLWLKPNPETQTPEITPQAEKIRLFCEKVWMNILKTDWHEDILWGCRCFGPFQQIEIFDRLQYILYGLTPELKKEWDSHRWEYVELACQLYPVYVEVIEKEKKLQRQKRLDKWFEKYAKEYDQYMEEDIKSDLRPEIVPLYQSFHGKSPGIFRTPEGYEKYLQKEKDMEKIQEQRHEFWRMIVDYKNSLKWQNLFIDAIVNNTENTPTDKKRLKKLFRKYKISKELQEIVYRELGEKNPPRTP